MELPVSTTVRGPRVAICCGSLMVTTQQQSRSLALKSDSGPNYVELQVPTRSFLHRQRRRRDLHSTFETRNYAN